jgi:hypothetical protein
MRKVELIASVTQAREVLVGTVERVYINDGERLSMIAIIDSKLPLPEDWKDVRVPEIKKAHTWCKKLLKDYVIPLDNIFELLPVFMWESYAIFGSAFDEHREVKILRRQKTALRRFVVSRERPQLFKMKRVEDGQKTK